MNPLQPTSAKPFRLLLIEDSPHRTVLIRGWLPENCLLVVAASAGKAIGILWRDRGYVYGAVMLEHDLSEQALTGTDLSLSGSDLVESLVTHLSRDVPIRVHISIPPACLGLRSDRSRPVSRSVASHSNV